MEALRKIKDKVKVYTNTHFRYLGQGRKYKNVMCPTSKDVACMEVKVHFDKCTNEELTEVITSICEFLENDSEVYWKYEAEKFYPSCEQIIEDEKRELEVRFLNFSYKFNEFVESEGFSKLTINDGCDCQSCLACTIRNSIVNVEYERRKSFQIRIDPTLVIRCHSGCQTYKLLQDWDWLNMKK